MSLIREDNYFLLFLELLEGDVQKIIDHDWLILNPFRFEPNLEVIHGNELVWNTMDITVSSGLINLDSSIEMGIDASRGERDSSRGILPIDASMTLQPIRNFSLTINDFPSFSAEYPMYNPDNIPTHPRSYDSYSNFLSTFTTIIPDQIYSNITADLDIPIDIDKDTPVPILNIPLDASMASSLRDNFYDEEIGSEISKIWNFDNVPLGLLFLNILDSNDNRIFSLYSPSLNGGLFPAEFIASNTRATECTPVALALSISNCIHNDFYNLALLQCKEFLDFQDYAPIAGLPSRFDRVWTKKDISNYQRDLTDNLLFTLFLLESLQSVDKKGTEKIFDRLLRSILNIINLALDLTPVDNNLTLEGYGEEGITIYNYSLTNSFLLTFIISKLLSSYYDEELHKRAVQIETASRNSFLKTINYKNLEELNNARFFFSAYLFNEVTDSETFKQYFSILKSELLINPPNDQIDKILYQYIYTNYDESFPEIISTEIVPSIYSEDTSPNQLDLYVSCIISLINKDFTLNKNLYPLKEANLAVKNNLRHSISLQSFPITEHWYSEEEVEGSIKELVGAINKPLSSFDIFVVETQSNDLRGKSLTNSANMLSLDRKVMEPDERLKDKLDLLENNDSTKQKIIDWIDRYKEVFDEVKEVNVKFHDLPDGYYRVEQFSELSAAFGYPPTTRYIYVEGYELSDLYKEALKNENKLGIPGIYAFYRDKNLVVFKSWGDLCGFVKVEINKGYSDQLYEFLKGNIPAGIDFNVVNNEVLSYGNF